MVSTEGPILLHDNIQPHVSQPTLQKLNELGYKVSPHPPYLVDFLPTDYHFLNHLDDFLQGECFCSQHWSTERAQFSMTRPDHTTNALKVKCIGLKALPHLLHSSNLSQLSHFFKHFGNFLHGTCFHNQQDVENAFQEFIEV